MTALLGRLFGRLPLGWLQLTHNPTRFASALAGVAFAIILVFVQLGFLGALMQTAVLPYRALDADILMSASDANTLTDGGNVARQRMLQALQTPGIASATPLYMARVDWEQPNGDTATLHVFGVEPGQRAFADPQIAANLPRLQILDAALIDRTTRSLDPEIRAALDAGAPVQTEMNGRTVTLAGPFETGAGFEADGYLATSDSTFLRLFPARSAGAPSHVLIHAEPGVSPAVLARRIEVEIGAADIQVRPLEAAAAADQRYQTTERPVGIVFGFGVVIGVLVGVIIVYQVLSSDVADHLKEYATLKAMGYERPFFLGVIVEEALVLATLGFIPGFLLSLALYAAVAAGTGLPVAMDAPRALAVFVGAIGLCTLSGAIATRRLAAADPADLF